MVISLASTGPRSRGAEIHRPYGMASERLGLCRFGFPRALRRRSQSSKTFPGRGYPKRWRCRRYEPWFLAATSLEAIATSTISPRPVRLGQPRTILFTGVENWFTLDLHVTLYPVCRGPIEATSSTGHR